MLPIVPVQPKHVSDYTQAAGDEAVERLRAVADPLRGLRVLHVSSTAFGGGVAELLHTQVPLMSDLGIETAWALIEGSDAFFAVTKAIHNALQGAETQLDDEMRATYLERIRANAPELPPGYDVVIIHDPQPATILQVLEENDARKGRWIWRCHIDLSAPYQPVWEFFEPAVNRFDAAIFTAEEYVQPGVSGPMKAFIPPSIDPLSPKNAPMSQGAWRAVIEPFGVDPDRPLVTQVSRFDPWKDPLGVIDSFRLVRKEVPTAQLVMAGSLAHDDPEGMRYLDLTNEHAAGDPDIYLFTDLDGVGDTAVNAFQRASDVVVQKSLREGFGLTVTEALWKSKPVIGGACGGITLQVHDYHTGFLVHSPAGAAYRVRYLLRYADKRQRMGRTAHSFVREHFLLTRHLRDYLTMLVDLDRA